MDPVATFLDALLRGFTSEVADHLADEVVIDDPHDGIVAGTQPVHRWIIEAHEWLSQLGTRAEPVRTTRAGDRAAAEWTVTLRAPAAGARELPVAAVFEQDAHGLLRAVRLYHSSWPLEGRHRIRGRVLPSAHVGLPAPVAAYQAALAAGEVDAVLACFEPDAVAREPAGAPWVHRGEAGLRAFYGALLSGGGIPLEHGGVVDDGTACALEYTVVRWGGAALPPQAGVAVYERGASGLLRAARIYDDVDPSAQRG